jgi:D-beta-D-heptose 7-phosphate kinase/D-beta-D-heptose 1-phosphate adenosyltransferase
MRTTNEMIDAFPGASVCVFGDAMLDCYVEGGVSRISPEAPVPVLHQRSIRHVLGGAANVAANIAGLGGHATLIAVTGADAAAGRLGSMLAAAGVRHRLTDLPDRATSLKTRIVAQRQQLLRIDEEDTRPVDPATARRLLDLFEAELPAHGLLVLSDYGKGVLVPEVVAGAIRLARSAGRPVVIDPKGTDYDRYRGANIVTPNLKELSEAVGGIPRSDAEITAAARGLIERCGIECLVVTRGADGMSIIRREAEAHLPTLAREVYDVSGAGDTVVAALSLALCSGLGYEAAARLGNVAAGIAVSKVGTAVVTAAELRHELEDRERSPASVLHTRIAPDREGAAAIVRGWRAAGIRVGFTNGCFDLLHPGHLALLERVRSRCDRLVVGLNSDASVRRLKGATRPVNDQAMRATMLAGLRAVDLVAIFEEDTPLELVAALEPDLLAKGGDYDRSSIVGADLVEARGGEVMVVDLVAGFSTTGLLRRLGAE